MTSIDEAMAGEVGWLLELVRPYADGFLSESSDLWYLDGEDDPVLSIPLAQCVAQWVVSTTVDANLMMQINEAAERCLAGNQTDAVVYATGFLEEVVEQLGNKSLRADQAETLLGPLARAYIEDWTASSSGPITF